MMTGRAMSRLRSRWLRVAGLLVFLFLSVPVPGGLGAESKDKADRPERGMSVYTEYSQLTIPVGETLRMDLTVENKGRRDENVTLTLANAPKGWKAFIKGGQFAIGGVPVAGEKSRVLTFTAEPDKDLRPGTYTFQIDGATADGAPRTAASSFPWKSITRATVNAS